MQIQKRKPAGRGMKKGKSVPAYDLIVDCAAGQIDAGGGFWAVVLDLAAFPDDVRLTIDVVGLSPTEAIGQNFFVTFWWGAGYPSGSFGAQGIITSYYIDDVPNRAESGTSAFISPPTSGWEPDDKDINSLNGRLEVMNARDQASTVMTGDLFHGDQWDSAIWSVVHGGVKGLDQLTQVVINSNGQFRAGELRIRAD